MLERRCLLALLLSAALPGSAAEPITKGALVELVDAGVDPSLVLRLVQRDCVAFEIDAPVLLELAPRLPREVLEAAMTCREAAARGVSLPPREGAPSPAERPGAPGYDLNELRRVALLPLVFDGVADEALTGAFRDETIRRGVTFELLDARVLSAEAVTGSLDSQTPLETLLPLAREAGAQALFLGSGTTRSVVGNPTLQVEVRLVETEHGRLLWQGDGASRGGDFGIDQRRRIAARNAARRLPW
jgi:hypothetical protein